MLNLSIHRENLSIFAEFPRSSFIPDETYKQIVSIRVKVSSLNEDRNTFEISFNQLIKFVNDEFISKAAIFSSREELILPGFGGLKLQFK